MTRRIRTLAIATLLLLAVTVGSATAGAMVTSARIKDGSVGSADVRNQSLTGADVKDGSLSAFFDFLGLVPGPQGDPGPQGYRGADGAPGLVQRAAPRTLAPGQRLTWTSYCDLDETAIGGGVSSERPDQVAIERSFPDGFHWTVRVHNPSSTEVRVYGWSLCVPV
jgi:hypothetical protein